MKVWVGLMGEELSDGLMLPFMGHGVREGKLFVFYLLILIQRVGNANSSGWQRSKEVSSKWPCHFIFPLLRGFLPFLPIHASTWPRLPFGSLPPGEVGRELS